MHDTTLILTLTGALAAGLIFGYATHLLRLSPIVGYLLAGVAIGPFTPGFTADQAIAQQLAEVGVMLLMFGVGLHFHLEDLWAVRRIAIPGAVTQIIVATTLGAGAAHLFGWSWQAGLVYGLSLSVASTVVLTRILVDFRQLHTPTGHAAVGWLIVEDLFTVLVLVVLPILIAGSSSAELAAALTTLGVKLLLLIAATYFLGLRVVPWLFTRAAHSSSQELFTLTVLVTALGIAVTTSAVFEVSMALGAFLAGTVVGRTEFSLRAAAEALPLRDAFAVIFFVSVGMLLDPTVLLEQPGLIAATLAIVLVGKTVAAFLIVLLLGYPIPVALRVSVALAQIGEFSFILATLGKQLGIISDLTMNALVATAIISITINPILFRCIPYLESWLADHPALYRILNARMRREFQDNKGGSEAAQEDSSHGHAIIVGYGPVGRTAARLLKENGIPSRIVELNLETSRRLKAEGVNVIYGDASRKETLLGAGVSSASTLILSASSIEAPAEMVREAKALNPGIRIIARTSYVREVDALRQAGCEAVFSGEGEVALAMIEEVLRTFGATQEQIERERLRVRNEISDGKI